ncbi:MAG TPA: HAD family hydrolase [Muricauda sp.]|uniref:HAD hydrolase-like protein n=1 Tax=Flagellimonas aurea TaxID=2915619 RepID=A0ABS3GAR9_9FLAO|nr:HAD family hydrolase [Allomuricauda aurea]MAO18530.1 HAD family hydrolase [Allomuricauda sp.]UBZ13112.1 HAD hydrolase-like protein [Allomuricauda aquimarina]MBC72930.1 HAD family hydrolase [Allomuricauda sp.]MBO0356147.1 HAD hydrolase-like protein [Allomuricauda aurea]HBU76966.1 HAD family hydrolase [Allomuricauda sp.]|tara:strand:+ start:847 stop:1551 length:705 start_codon:yes stop_codon:yes gene_type:complete
MEVDFSNIKTIGFDADDTLWVNETYFRDTEEKFAELLEGYETKNKIDQELFKMEMANLDIYGYGIKGFMLSMIESALDLSNNKVSQETIAKILELGKSMISHPVELLDGVEEVLSKLMGRYRLIVLTKGDLLDQERKLERSGLSQYFHHVEVLSDKKENNYKNLLEHLKIDVNEFLMIGNSLKSDVLPILNIGAQAVHVPFHTTWAHEMVSEDEMENNHLKLNGLKDILKYLDN